MKRSELTCLEDFLDLPHLKPYDWSALPAKDFGNTARQQKGDTQEPEREAIKFYALGHLVSLIRQKRTPHEKLTENEKSILAAYQHEVANQSRRMAFYVMLIISREVRHVWEGENPDTETRKKFEKEVGKPLMDWQKQIRGSNYATAITHFDMLPDDLTAAEFCRGVTYLFNHGYCAHGFGGKPWANISETLYRALKGEYSMEMLVDTAYTLAHNNGPIFNKGMYYDPYGPCFVNILDVQRAGLIPEMLHEQRFFAEYVDYNVLQLVRAYKQENPEAFGDYLDWHEVKARGAVGNCQQFYAKMNPKAKKAPKPKMLAPGKYFAGEYQVDVNSTLITYKRVA